MIKMEMKYKTQWEEKTTINPLKVLIFATYGACDQTVNSIFIDVELTI